MDTTTKRACAQKLSIKDILGGTFVLGAESEPNYLLLDTKKIHRLNLLAIVVNKEKVGTMTSFLVDDGSEKITLRFFEENKTGDLIQIGDSILCIGKVREYNKERYIAPEILKRINPSFLKLRIAELSLKIKPIQSKNEAPKEEIKKEEEQEVLGLPSEKIQEIIRELDVGDGVLVEEVVARSPLKETDSLIQKMLERGEIFQCRPGKIKIL